MNPQAGTQMSAFQQAQQQAMGQQYQQAQQGMGGSNGGDGGLLGLIGLQSNGQPGNINGGPTPQQQQTIGQMFGGPAAVAGAAVGGAGQAAGQAASALFQQASQNPQIQQILQHIGKFLGAIGHPLAGGFPQMQGAAAGGAAGQAAGQPGMQQPINQGIPGSQAASDSPMGTMQRMNSQMAQ
jgi:hypothetical protein